MKKRGRIILGLLLVTLLLLIIGCDTGGSDESDAVYAIGDTGPAGGLIFYIDEADEFSWTYLEVAPESTELSTSVWGGAGTTYTGADGTAIGTGAKNTVDIVTQFGASEPFANKKDYAAKVCSNLGYGGYDDWFLPSKDELKAIWDNLVNDGTGNNSGVGGFIGYYWSSSRYNNSSYQAWGGDFYATISYDVYFETNSPFHVRAIRAF